MKHRTRKLLYIVNLDFPPVAGPGVWRVLALAKYAARAGHEVHVFCADRSTWHDRTDDKLLDQLPAGVEVTRISSLYEKDMLEKLDVWRQSPHRLKHFIGSRLHSWVKRYLPDEIIHWVLKAAKSVIQRGFRERPDAIVTTGPPHLVHLTGYLLSLCRKNTVWMMDFRDPWVEDPAYGEVHTGPYQYSLMLRLQRIFIRRATWVTAVTPGFLEPLRGFAADASSADKFKVITNGHDLSPETPSPPDWKLRRDRRLVVHFNGTIQKGNDIFPSFFRAVAAYREVSKECGLPPLCLSFCGISPKTKDLAARMGIAGDIHDHGPLTQSDSQDVSRLADILLVTVNPNMMSAHGIVPAKLYEAIALGKPILALVPDPSDVRNILDGDPLSACVSPIDEKAMTNSLVTFARMAMKGELAQDAAGKEFRLRLAKRYGRKHLSEEILELLGFPFPGDNDTG